MKGPSNPSAFSSELQTFIVTKYDPLLVILQELNERLSVGEKERFYLERRVTVLENQIKRLHEAKDHEKASDEIHVLDEKRPQDNMLLKSSAALKPWLFSMKDGTMTSAVQLLLEYTPHNTVQIDARDLRRENDLWILLLEAIPPAYSVERPSSSRLSDLRYSARQVLLNICRGELLIVIRNIPGKSAMSGDSEKNPSVTLVAVLVASIAEAWERLSDLDKIDLGRIAIVLVGNGLGKRLRAGHSTYDIEPLN